MSFVFALLNDSYIGIELLTAILKKDKIDVDVVLSRFNFLEMAYLQYASRGDDQYLAKKARKVLDDDKSQMMRQLASLSPGVIGLSINTDLYHWNVDLAKSIKRDLPHVPVIAGGPHPTLSAEQVINEPEIDAIIVGEADSCITEAYRSLCSDLPRDVPGLWYKINGVIRRNGVAPLPSDLDILPFKDLSPFINRNPVRKNVYTVLTCRGCPYNCAYCNSPSLKRMYRDSGAYLRKRSPENVLSELLQAKDKYAPKEIRFSDDVFTFDKKWLKEFLPNYTKSIALPFYCLVHPEQVDDEIIEMLKIGGCHTIKCGIQTINQEISRNIFKRNLNLEKIKHVINKVKECNIAIKVDFIIGTPTETEKDLNDLIDFIKEINVDDIFLYFLRYYPNTPILDYAFRNGFLTSEDMADIERGNELAYQIIPTRFKGETHDMYVKYNNLIRQAAGSNFRIDNFSYLLES